MDQPSACAHSHTITQYVNVVGVYSGRYFRTLRGETRTSELYVRIKNVICPGKVDDFVENNTNYLSQIVTRNNVSSPPLAPLVTNGN